VGQNIDKLTAIFKTQTGFGLYWLLWSTKSRAPASTWVS